MVQGVTLGESGIVLSRYFVCMWERSKEPMPSHVV